MSLLLILVFGVFVFVSCYYGNMGTSGWGEIRLHFVACRLLKSSNILYLLVALNETVSFCYSLAAEWYLLSVILLYRYPCHAEFSWENIKNIFAFSIISQNWDGTCHWNFYSWKTVTYLSCTIDIMAVGGLATTGARVSVAMILISSPRIL